MTQPARVRSNKAERAEPPDGAACSDPGRHPLATSMPPLPGLAVSPDAARQPENFSAHQQLGQLRRQAATAGSVVRRAPVPGPVDGEFTDVNAYGFVFVPTGKPSQFRIKDSDITLQHHPDTDQWTNADGLVVEFQPSGPRRVPPKGDKALQHYSMRKFNALSPPEKMIQIGYLAADFGFTPYEEELFSNDPDEEIIELYRYHKFRADSGPDAVVFGGGMNKAEITDKVAGKTKVVDWQDTGILKLLKVRHDSLAQLRGPGVEGAVRATKAMEIFQANAMTTPFIATTMDEGYARSLFDQYPPEPTQRAVILVIKGPRANTFDFEAEFRRLVRQGNGAPEGQNGRVDPKRAHDNEQAEYGLADVFIPAKGKSQFGFWIADVIPLGLPNRDQAAAIGSHPGTEVVRERGLPDASSDSKEQMKGKDEA